MANIKFNIDPYRMAIRNLNELSFDAPAGSNSAFTHNAANIKFHVKDTRSLTIYKGGISTASPDGPLKTILPPFTFLSLNVVIYVNV
jgi:hypothetical protein